MVGRGPKLTFPSRAAAALIFLVAPFAGCSGPSFFVDVPEWKAGYAWEYEEERIESVEMLGNPPAFLEEEQEEYETLENRTYRLEVFNSTAYSVEGLPIYAVAVLSRVLPDANQSLVQTDFWDAWVYTADLNHAEPTFVDWRTQEVQLSADPGPEDPNATEEDNATYPANEDRLLDWPLTRGHRWVNEQFVPGIDDEPGLLTASAQREATVRVPAGSFKAVRLRAVLEPYDTSEIEGQLDDELEADGGRVRALSFRHTITHEYAYAAEVLNLVEHAITTETRVSARGRDGDGNDYDFTFIEKSVTRRELFRYQLLDGAQKPLSFALDVIGGVYSPKPIIAAAHFAVEIVANKPDLNLVSSDSATFGVRIYNSTAGEKPLRAREASFPEVASASAEYDHDQLEILWSLQWLDIAGRFREFKNLTGDTASIAASELLQGGLKQIEATLKLKDSARGRGQEIFTDTVLFEVFYHANLTYTRAATNVTPNELVSVRFPVEPSSKNVRVNATVQGAPPEAQCAVAGSQDCLRVADGANVNVPDGRSDRMRFETMEPTRYTPGSWRASYQPSAPGQAVLFEVRVRYGPTR